MICILFVALASLVVAAFGQVAPTPPSACQEILQEGACSICGAGSCISDQDAIFEFPGQPPAPCSLLQEGGYTGQIPLDQCSFLPPLIGVCECRAFVPTLAPSPEPTRAPIVPTPPGACPKIPPEGGCSICGAGSCISDQDAIFEFPGQPAVPCSLLQEGGYTGQISLDQCSFLPPLIGVCECRAFVPTLAPSPEPTRAPIVPTPPGACPKIPPEGGCSICGAGSCVTMPDAIFASPFQPAIPCGLLQDAGFVGAIPLDECGAFPFLPESGVCECRAYPPRPPFPTPAPTTRALIAPTPPGTCLEIPPEGVCSICGAGSCVTMPDAIFVFPGQPSLSCSVLQDEGFNGQIPLNECRLILPSLIGEFCECRPFGETLAPSPAPTSAPRPPGAPSVPTTAGAPIDPMVPMVPTFEPSSPTPAPKTVAPSAYGKTPVPAPAFPTSDTKGKKDGKKKMSKIRKP